MFSREVIVVPSHARTLRGWVAAIICMAGVWAVAIGSARAGELRYLQIMSPSLGRPMPALIYLPDGYAGGALKYPVAYLLHGAGGNETVWLRHGNILNTMDSLIAKRAVPPSIVVMP